MTYILPDSVSPGSGFFFIGTCVSGEVKCLKPPKTGGVTESNSPVTARLLCVTRTLT